MPHHCCTRGHGIVVFISMLRIIELSPLSSVSLDELFCYKIRCGLPIHTLLGTKLLSIKQRSCPSRHQSETPTLTTQTTRLVPRLPDYCVSDTQSLILPLFLTKICGIHTLIDSYVVNSWQKINVFMFVFEEES